MCTRARQAFVYAMVFLTRLPVARWVTDTSEATVHRAVYCYPLVGAVIGVLLLLTGWLFSGLGALVAAAMVLTAWVLVTGALHLDGLADCTDAYYAGHKHADLHERRQSVLRVMKDPHCGAVALVVIALVLIVKFALLAQLLGGPGGWPALLVAPVLARTVILPFMSIGRYARENGLAPVMPAAQANRLWCVSALVAVLLALTLGVWPALLLVATLVVLMLAWWRFWQRQIGGYTGDCLGALVELVEVFVLLVLLTSLVG